MEEWKLALTTACTQPFSIWVLSSFANNKCIGINKTSYNFIINISLASTLVKGKLIVELPDTAVLETSRTLDSRPWMAQAIGTTLPKTHQPIQLHPIMKSRQ